MENNIKLEMLFYEADLDIKAGKFDQAVDKLNQILKEDSSFGKAYNHLGWLYETKFKNYEKAEYYYKICLEKSPEYPAIYTNLSIFISTIGKYDELKKILERSLTIPGVDKSKMYYEFGIMYEKQREFEKAIKYYTDCAKDTLIQTILKNATDGIERCKSKMKI